jgi:peptidoglycan/xylan/chitin deacetylase (PgdA/CDA1 family)
MARRVRSAAAQALRSLLWWTDRGLAAASLAVRRETPALMILLFHGLFRDRAELEQEHTHPMEGLTVSHLKIILDHFCSCGYRFVGPADVLNGLRQEQRYAMLTFDDSYARHQVALPVLAEYCIPGSFFITTTQVLENKGYWWDTLYRERRQRGVPRSRIDLEIQHLKTRTAEDIDAYLAEAFGAAAVRPRGDIDRPFTPAELAAFAREPGVHLGNHTCDHAILTNYPLEGIRSQVIGAQEAIAAMTGRTPIIIAYPNGNHNDGVVRISLACGLQLGVTAEPQKNPLPITPDSRAAMRLGRFGFADSRDLTRQCERFRSDLSLYRWQRRLRSPH